VTGGEHDTNAKQLAIIASATQDLFVLGVLIASLRGEINPWGSGLAKYR